MSFVRDKMMPKAIRKESDICWSSLHNSFPKVFL